MATDSTETFRAAPYCRAYRLPATCRGQILPVPYIQHFLIISDIRQSVFDKILAMTHLFLISSDDQKRGSAGLSVCQIQRIPSFMGKIRFYFVRSSMSLSSSRAVRTVSILFSILFPPNLHSNTSVSPHRKQPI